MSKRASERRNVNQQGGAPLGQPATAVWQAPVILRVGNVRDIVASGGGKISALGGDPGDTRKQVGSG